MSNKEAEKMYLISEVLFKNLLTKLQEKPCIEEVNSPDTNINSTLANTAAKKMADILDKPTSLSAGEQLAQYDKAFHDFKNINHDEGDLNEQHIGSNEDEHKVILDDQSSRAENSDGIQESDLLMVMKEKLTAKQIAHANEVMKTIDNSKGAIIVSDGGQISIGNVPIPGHLKHYIDSIVTDKKESSVNNFTVKLAKNLIALGLPRKVIKNKRLHQALSQGETMSKWIQN